jgi:hypothetical protein
MFDRPPDPRAWLVWLIFCERGDGSEKCLFEKEEGIPWQVVMRVEEGPEHVADENAGTFKFGN